MVWKDLPNAPPEGTLLCAATDVLDGQPKCLELDTSGGPQSPFRLLLLRSGADVKAFVNRCAHFGVPLAAKPQQLMFKPHISITCNVHYARYRWHDGSCESGDCAGEALIPVPLEEAPNGQLRIAASAPSNSARKPPHPP